MRSAAAVFPRSCSFTAFRMACLGCTLVLCLLQNEGSSALAVFAALDDLVRLPLHVHAIVLAWLDRQVTQLDAQIRALRRDHRAGSGIDRRELTVENATDLHRRL